MAEDHSHTNQHGVRPPTTWGYFGKLPKELAEHILDTISKVHHPSIFKLLRTNSVIRQYLESGLLAGPRYANYDVLCNTAPVVEFSAIEPFRSHSSQAESSRSISSQPASPRPTSSQPASSQTESPFEQQSSNEGHVLSGSSDGPHISQYIQGDLSAMQLTSERRPKLTPVWKTLQQRATQITVDISRCSKSTIPGERKRRKVAFDFPAELMDKINRIVVIHSVRGRRTSKGGYSLLGHLHGIFSAATQVKQVTLGSPSSPWGDRCTFPLATENPTLEVAKAISRLPNLDHLTRHVDLEDDSNEIDKGLHSRLPKLTSCTLMLTTGLKSQYDLKGLINPHVNRLSSSSEFTLNISIPRESEGDHGGDQLLLQLRESVQYPVELASSSISPDEWTQALTRVNMEVYGPPAETTEESLQSSSGTE